MSRKAIISAFILVHAAVMSAQVDQRGSVTLYDSGKTPLAGVQVTSFGAPATDTDQHGAFVLRFPDRSPGMSAYTDLYKKGYELVNRDEMSKFILSEKNVLKAVMAPVGTVESVKMEYYGIASENYSRRCSAAMQEINDLYSAREITLEQRRARLDSLNMESEIYWNNLEHYTERFARINPDDVEGIDKMVLESVRKGDLEEAVRIYEDARIVEQAMARIQTRESLQEDIEALLLSLQRYSDLCAIIGGWEYQKKSVEIKRKLAELCPDDFNMVKDYVLALHLYDDEALMWHDRLIAAAADDYDLADAVKLKAEYMRWKGDLESSLDLYQLSFELSSGLFDKEPYVCNLYLALSTMTSYMRSAHASGEYDQVIDLGQEALDILGDVDMEEFDVIHLSVLNSMVEASYSKKDWKMYGKLTDARYEFMKKVESEGTLDFGGMDAEYVRTGEKMRYATDSGNLDDMYKYSAELLKLIEPLFRKDPSLYVGGYVSNLELSFQKKMTDNPGRALEFAEEYRRFVTTEILPSLNEVEKCNVMYNVEYLYVWYYQKQSRFEESYPYVRKMNEYADVLAERALSENMIAVMTSRSKMVEMLLRHQDEDLKDAVLDLEALYDHVKFTYGFSDTVAESDIASGYYMIGEYQLALDYYDAVRSERESVLKLYPDNFEVKANLSSTYHNIAGCLSALHRDSEALSNVKKSIDIIADLYDLRPTSYGPNYFQYLGNAVAMAHWAGNGRQAEKFLEMQRNLAYDLASRSRTFRSLPYAYRLLEHDYLQATGRKVNPKDYQDVFKYKSGSIENDWILVNLIRARSRSGNVFAR